MKKLKKVLKQGSLVLLIVLAGIGIGIVGGVPIVRSGKKEDRIEGQTEVVESKEAASQSIEFKNIN